MSPETLILAALVLPLLIAAGIAVMGWSPNLREGVTFTGAGLLFAVIILLTIHVAGGERPELNLGQAAPGLSMAFKLEPLGMLFALVATWNNYFLPLIMLTDPSLFPLTVGLAQLQAASEAGGGASAQFSTVITGSLVSIVPLVIAFLYLQRYWQSGLSTGSVKE